MNRGFIILLFILFSTITYSQNTFQKTFGGTNDDVTVDFEKTDDNGLLLLGYTKSFGSGSNDIIITKLDFNGEVQWCKLFGNTGSDTGHDIIKTDNGDYIICGTTASSGAGSDDIYILRINDSGDLIWSKTYGGSGWEQPRGKAIETSNGDFIIISTTLSFGYGGKDIHFLRISSTGEMLTTKIYGGNNNDWVHDFVQLDNGDILLGGRLNHSSGGSFGGLIRVDEYGSLIWAKTYNTSGFCKFYRLKKSNTGEIIAVGRIDSYGAGNADLYVVSIDQNGSLNWAKTYGGPGYELANGVDVTSDQKIIFSGYIGSYGFGNNDIFLIKINNDGSFIWGKTYGGPANDNIYCGSDLVNFNNSAYFINGRTKSFGMGNYDMYLIKTDTAGISGCNEQDFTPTITSPPINVNSIQLYIDQGGIENDPITIVTDLLLPVTTLCPDDSPIAQFVSNDTLICTNNCINYIDSSLNNPTSWNWYFEGGTPSFSNAQNPLHICYYNPGQFDVKLVVSNQYGSDSVLYDNYIIVYPSPEINLGNDTLLCIGDSLILNAGGEYTSYLWNTGSIDSIIIVDSSGIYWVQVENEFGCIALDSIIIEIYPMAFEELNLGPDTTFCYGGSFVLNAGSGYTFYQWQDGTSDSIFIADTAGVYYVYVENPCGFGSDTIILDVFPISDIDLGNDTVVCFGESILLDPGFGFESYLWQDGYSNQFYYASQSGSYWVQVVDENSCLAYDTINLEFILPNPDIGNDTVICYGDSVTFVTNPIFENYLWNDGSNLHSFTADSAGIIWCEVIDTMGCVGRDSVLLDILFPPQISLGNDAVFCVGDSLWLYALPYGNNYNLTWQDGSQDSMFMVTQQGNYWVLATNQCDSDVDSIFVSIKQLPFVYLGNDTILAMNDYLILDAGEGFENYLWNDGSSFQTMTVHEAGNYWVNVFDGLCYNADTINIEPVECDILIPVVITPNGDTKNDFFFAETSEDIYGFYLVVFSRWGEKIWETENKEEKWDGIKNGRPIADGTYYWITKYKCKGAPEEFEKKGCVTVLK